MRSEHAVLLACPTCRGDLRLEARTHAGGHVEEGSLHCDRCTTAYPVLHGIPRFVPVDNYAANFGFQWDRHHRTQHDSHTGVPISENRFYETTGWGRELAGEVLLEVGSGAGRFTEVAAATGATVVSVDYSRAVEANYRNHRHLPHVLVVQADVYALPFRRRSFDRVFCLGVLQHTPDVRKALEALPAMLKPGGYLAFDLYHGRWWKKLVWPRYWLRPLTRRLKPETLYRLCRRWVHLLWPLCRILNRLPGGNAICKLLVVCDHTGTFPLSDAQLREWAVLDTMDWLGAWHDDPQPMHRVREWVRDLSLDRAEVVPGHNGLEGRARVPRGFPLAG